MEKERGAETAPINLPESHDVTPAPRRNSIWFVLVGASVGAILGLLAYTQHWL